MEALRGIEVPEIYQKRRIAGEAFRLAREGKFEHTPTDAEKLKNIKNILDSDALARLIDDGKITLGIVKPRANQGKGYGGLSRTDEEAAGELLDEIGRDKIMFDFSVQLTEDQVEEFYAPNKESQSSRILDEESGISVWDTVVKHAASSPLTFFLIYHDGNELDAVEWWREKMGATNPTKARPDTIRGKYARNILLPNNLVHGSDSRESAKREVGILSKVVGSKITALASR